MSLNIPDISLFLCKNCNPPEKSHPLFPKNPLKIEILSSHLPFLKIWLEAQPPSRNGGGDAHYAHPPSLVGSWKNNSRKSFAEDKNEAIVIVK